MNTLIDWFTPAIGLVGVGLGVIFSYFLQSKTQKNAWKREYSVEIAETVYSALYSNVKGIIATLEKGAFYGLDFNAWRECQHDHRHLQVQPKSFRERLDKLLTNVESYESDVLRVYNEIIPEIETEASKKTFGLTADKINVEVKYKTASGAASITFFDAFECLIQQKSPRQRFMEIFPRFEALSFSVQFQNIRETVGLQPTSFDESKLNEFWQLCIELEQKNEVYNRTLQKQSLLLEESKSIFEELEKRIEEPWRI